MRGSARDEDRAVTAEDYLRLLAREPDSLRFAEYADRLRGMEKLADAAALCEFGLARHPTYATGHVVMAEILLEAGMREKAAAEAREALRLDPYHPRAHVALGECLHGQGETQGAVVEFEAALRCAPGLPEAQARLIELKGKAPGVHPPSVATRGESGRKPGERPGWLTEESAGDLTAAVAQCAAVESAAMGDALGCVIAGSMPAGSRGETAEQVGELVGDGRGLVSRLGAGRLRSAVVCGRGARMLCVPLGDLVLVAGLRPGVGVDEAAGQVEAAVSAGPAAAEVANDA